MRLPGHMLIIHVTCLWQHIVSLAIYKVSRDPDLLTVLPVPFFWTTPHLPRLRNPWRIITKFKAGNYKLKAGKETPERLGSLTYWDPVKCFLCSHPKEITLNIIHKVCPWNILTVNNCLLLSFFKDLLPSFCLSNPILGDKLLEKRFHQVPN